MNTFNFTIGQAVQAVYRRNCEKFNAEGVVRYDYNDGFYDVELESGQTVTVQGADIYPYPSPKTRNSIIEGLDGSKRYSADEVLEIVKKAFEGGSK